MKKMVIDCMEKSEEVIDLTGHEITALEASFSTPEQDIHGAIDSAIKARWSSDTIMINDILERGHEAVKSERDAIIAAVQQVIEGEKK